MIKQIIILIILILALIGGVSLINGESIGEFQLGQDVEIFQTCNNCTYCNFTRVMGLNNRTIFTNLEATQDDTYFYYNMDSNNFTKLGEYSYCYKCGNTIESDTGCLDFTMTYTGGELNLSIIILYIASLGFLVFIFVLNLLLINKLPDKDATDEAGTILQLSDLKHFRKVLWGVAWGLVLAMLFLISNVTLGYLPNTMFGNFFFMLYKLMFLMTIIAVPLLFIWIFAGIFRDKEFKRLIERGIDIKTP